MRLKLARWLLKGAKLPCGCGHYEVQGFYDFGACDQHEIRR